jgi:hypothetical protein
VTHRLMYIALALILTSCSTLEERKFHRQLEQLRRDALAKIDVPACTAAGGTVHGVCMFGMPACVLPYSDAGKVCTDKSECQGRCLQVGAGATPGTQAVGACEATNEPCGCTSPVEHGVATQGICED